MIINDKDKQDIIRVLEFFKYSNDQWDNYYKANKIPHETTHETFTKCFKFIIYSLKAEEMVNKFKGFK